MNKPGCSQSQDLFRVWIASYEGWHPAGWNETPPEAVAVAAAEDDCFTADEAAAYLEGFNTGAGDDSSGLWAIAVPVVVRYDGDLQPGEKIRPRQLMVASR